MFEEPKIKPVPCVLGIYILETVYSIYQALNSFKIHSEFHEYNTRLTISLTKSLMGSRGSMLHSQVFSSNPYPEPNQLNSSY